MKWLLDFLFKRFLKNLLDKLPLNNYKSLIGIILLVLSAAISSDVIPSELRAVLLAVVEYLKPYAGVITDVGIATFVTGAVHKVLKWIFPKQS